MAPLWCFLPGSGKSLRVEQSLWCREVPDSSVHRLEAEPIGAAARAGLEVLGPDRLGSDFDCHLLTI